MSGLIKKVLIRKLWGIKDIETSFNEDVNIFIGTNGTSKTTLLNLIEAVLTVDMNILADIHFSEVELHLENMHKSIILKVSKNIDNFDFLKYQFNELEAIELPIVDFSRRVSMNRIHLQYRDNYERVLEQIKELISISWLSIHRGNIQPDEFERGRERNKSYVDDKLFELTRKLSIYRLQLEADAGRLSADFKQDVFKLMLFDDSFDIVDINNLSSFETDKIKDSLFKTFKELGIPVEQVKDRILNHINKISISLKTIQDHIIGSKNGDSDGLNINDVLPLPLVNRTLKLIEIANNIEIKKEMIIHPINQYLKCLKEFMPNKEFVLDKESSGELKIFANDKQIEPISIPLSSLSSGEKQLLILLTETLLQRNQKYVFIADEPELSLHIGWQRKIIEIIRSLNCNAQIIVATHSPELAANWENNIINMEKISSYE